MSLFVHLYKKVDPEHLISHKAWMAIGAFVAQAGLLCTATITLMLLEKERVDTYFPNAVLILSFLSVLIFTLLLYSIVRTVKRIMKDREAYRQLHEEQQNNVAFTQNLLNILPTGYHSVNAEGIIIDMNKTELDWLGYQREEVVEQMHISDLYGNEEYRGRFDELFEHFKKSGFSGNMEQTLVCKNGDLIPALVTSKALYDSEGHFWRNITTVYNFSERKKLENELIAARLEADNARRLKQLFMANMSHEIRTPLNAILGFAKLLERASLQEPYKEYLESIRISGANLLNIVNDILDFEKIRSGMLRIEQIDFDLQGLLHSIVTMVRPSAEEKHVHLSLKTGPNLPSVLSGDPMRLTQILVNLLGNAIKFTEFGSVTLCVDALPKTDPTDSTVRIRFEVEDTGIGIDEAEHVRIFERFAQAATDMSRKYGGTGLGLSLVRMLVELQQGEIRLESTPGKGSTFTVEIPYQPGHNGKAISAAHYPVDNQPLPDLSGYHVLLVEDNPMNRRIAELTLLEFGLQVTMASDGYEALGFLTENPTAFDLVFVDIQMPGMDGHTTAQKIRSELGLLILPLVAMTAHVFAAEREKVMSSGMNDFLTKPINQNELITVLLRFLPGFWNPAAFREYTMGNTTIGLEIAQMFIRQFKQEIKAFTPAIGQKDFAQIASLAHYLRSTAAYSGFQQSLGATLMQMEAEAKKERPNSAQLGKLYQKLANDSRRAVAIMQRETGHLE